MQTPLRHYHSIPAFTHGGSSDAEMATPTRLEVFLPEIASATPTPEGSATKKPTMRLKGSPRLTISSVGQPGQMFPRWRRPSGVQTRPTTMPQRNWLSEGGETYTDEDADDFRAQRLAQ